MDKKTVRDVPVCNRRVLVRVDFNVPINEQTGEITDDSRIRASLPTIEYLINNDAKVILCSHLGRPKGKRDLRYSLEPVASRLSQILGKKLNFHRTVSAWRWNIWLIICRTPGYYYLKTCAFIRMKKRTIHILRINWLSSEISM